MSVDSMNLNSPGFIDKIDESFPKFKELRENRKVQIVAKQVFKALACIACGAGLGLLACTPIGASIAIGMGAGAAAGAFVYLAVASVHAAIQAFGFPSNRYLVAPPVTIENWSSDKKHNKFIKILTEISKLDCFKEWLVSKKITAAEGADRIWKEFQGGLCQGQSQELVSLMKKHHDLTGGQLVHKLKAKKVFKRQIFEIIRADLPNNQEIAALANNIPDSKPLFHKSFSKSDLKHDHSLLLKELKDAKDSLEDPFQVLCATIRLQGDSEAHTIFVELHPTYRIYDTSNHIYTGLYEGFKTEKRFLKSLQRHIEGYHSAIRPTAVKFDDIIVRGYIVDQPKLRDAVNTAKAGGQPTL